MSKIIAAFAPVSGAFYGQNSSMDCNPGRSAIPIIEFHGSDDTVIPYAGGSRKGDVLPSIPDWLAEWASRDGDKAKNTTSDEFKDNVQISTWKDFTIGYLIDGLGHAWPSTEPNDDSSDGTVLNATTVIMEFFANNTLSDTSNSTPAPASATSTSSSTSTETPASETTGTSGKSAASSVTISFGWEHTLFFLGLSLFFSL